MRALVTGSEGFIGRHLCRALDERGWMLTTVDVRHERIPWDARDTFRDETPPYFDLVVHAAAVVNGRETIDRRPLDQAVDLELDAGLFGWARRSAPGCVVYLSSSAVYPVHLQRAAPARPLSEWMVDPDLPLLPDALYGWTKLTGERLADLYRREGHRVVVVRPFSGYGSYQDACYPFPAIIDRAVRRELPFTLWGSGRQVRDFVHVDDVVGAILAAIENNVDGPVNIGTGRPTPMIELAQLACTMAHHIHDSWSVTGELEGVAYRVADTQLLSSFYEPKVSLEEGIARALKERSWVG